MSRTRKLVALVSGVLALVLGVLWWQQRQAGPGEGQAVSTLAPTLPSASPTRASSATSGSATPSAGSSASASASDSAAPSGCDTRRTPIVPTRMTISSMDVTAPVLSLGMADDGSVATPPFSQPHSVGWFNQGPKPGADKGKAVITAHTFHNGGALGNELFDHDSGLKPGAVIQLADGKGHVQCFRYTAAQKIMVKDYDPDSTAIYDTKGQPVLAIVICWDWQPATKFWASRIVFYATPMAA